ncbi:hypothetical protein [Gorillibacterium sp. CAU 1737]|uniref:hypothetical protein n=1 Tax=Gorillibacterium sp. CAU 1737 TaxID=3140362 RepID=UPI0032614968
MNRTITRYGGVSALFLALLLLSLLGSPAKAEAGAYGSIKSFFQLPGKVDELQENYQKIQEQYQDTREELESTRQQAEESALKAQQTADQLLLEQERLAKENSTLAEQNRLLSQELQELQDTNELRKKTNRRLRIALYTGAGLLAAVFFSGRFTRLVLRRRR